MCAICIAVCGILFGAICVSIVTVFIVAIIDIVVAISILVTISVVVGDLMLCHLGVDPCNLRDARFSESNSGVRVLSREYIYHVSDGRLGTEALPFCIDLQHMASNELSKPVDMRSS